MEWWKGCLMGLRGIKRPPVQPVKYAGWKFGRQVRRWFLSHRRDTRHMPGEAEG